MTWKFIESMHSEQLKNARAAVIEIKSRLSDSEKKSAELESQIKKERSEYKKSLKKAHDIARRCREYDPLDCDITDVKNKVRKFKNRINPQKTFLITMFMANGTIEHFILSTSEPTFKRDKKNYVIDTSLSYRINTSKYMGLTYHENISIPIKIDIPVKDIIDTMTASNCRVEASLNPSTLTRFVKSEVIRMLLTAVTISKWMKIVTAVSCLSLMLNAAVLIVILKTNGYI